VIVLSHTAATAVEVVVAVLAVEVVAAVTAVVKLDISPAIALREVTVVAVVAVAATTAVTVVTSPVTANRLVELEVTAVTDVEVAVASEAAAALDARNSVTWLVIALTLRIPEVVKVVRTEVAVAFLPTEVVAAAAVLVTTVVKMVISLVTAHLRERPRPVTPVAARVTSLVNALPRAPKLYLNTCIPEVEVVIMCDCVRSIWKRSMSCNVVRSTEMRAL